MARLAPIAIYHDGMLFLIDPLLFARVPYMVNEEHQTQICLGPTVLQRGTYLTRPVLPRSTNITHYITNLLYSKPCPLLTTQGAILYPRLRHVEKMSVHTYIEKYANCHTPHKNKHSHLQGNKDARRGDTHNPKPLEHDPCLRRKCLLIREGTNRRVNENKRWNTKQLLPDATSENGGHRRVFHSLVGTAQYEITVAYYSVDNQAPTDLLVLTRVAH